MKFDEKFVILGVALFRANTGTDMVKLLVANLLCQHAFKMYREGFGRKIFMT